jgi:hypothetical protein
MSDAPTTTLSKERINWRAIGMRPVTKRELLPPGEANTSKVGVAFSENLLRRIDALARRRFPEKKQPRSSYIRLLIAKGIEAEEGENWREEADQVLYETYEAR